MDRHRDHQGNKAKKGQIECITNYMKQLDLYTTRSMELKRFFEGKKKHNGEQEKKTLERKMEGNCIHFSFANEN